MTVKLDFGRFTLVPAGRQLLENGKPITLGARAFDVLLTLIERSDRIVTKEELLEIAWPKLVVEENNLQVQISSLRKILGADAISTIPGRGYRFGLDIERPAPDWHTRATESAARSFASSIAVLPFANVSGEPENEAFADGLAEDLLNVLCKIDGLRVVSRTSSFYFKGKTADIATIASKLNVATILEGSVRKSGTRVRIAAQLIDVATDSHLWSGTYDRELADIFVIQDEIATSIVTELRAETRRPPQAITSGSQAAEVAFAARGRTTISEAWHNFLRGRLFASRQTHADSLKALECYEQATSLDPTFASAWAAAASQHAHLAGYGGHASTADGFRRARAAAHRALDLEPGLAAGHSIISWIQLYCDWDWKAAEASSIRALQLAPNDAGVLTTAAVVAGNCGRERDAADLVHRASLLDPLNASSHRNIAFGELDMGHLDDALTAIQRALELNPQLGLAYFCLGLIHLTATRAGEALQAFEKEPLDDYRLLGITLAHHASESANECASALARLTQEHGDVSPCQVAEAHAWLGHADVAFEWLDRAYAARNPRLVEVRGDPLLKSLHDHPRWLSLLEKMGFSN